MTWRSNQDSGRVMARLLTAVGLLRASIGPPIITMVFGACGSRASAISETAHSTGTVGWHTEITCKPGESSRTNSHT
jgi:hypothetical protein